MTTDWIEKLAIKKEFVESAFLHESALDERATIDVVLPMQDPYMTQIADGRKNYEFRECIIHVCEMMSARTRKPGDRPLDEDSLGSVEFNGKRKDWDGCDFAYEMVTVYELKRPITLKEMKEKHSISLVLPSTSREIIRHSILVGHLPI
ncbi:hypothetical protein I7I51_04901 [Histoplasma capsulatum]|uniref:Uncharacterized protein n=1 Tax=Ajellomyces capsulatus TaxID=5037 RepID=A0A8A1M636_AJECA|nr:hypothetical protein I7I51_04901 [Histoplasma capsulatum]